MCWRSIFLGERQMDSGASELRVKHCIREELRHPDGRTAIPCGPRSKQRLRVGPMVREPVDEATYRGFGDEFLTRGRLGQGAFRVW
jgi:hypothetical protein